MTQCVVVRGASSGASAYSFSNGVLESEEVSLDSTADNGGSESRRIMSSRKEEGIIKNKEKIEHKMKGEEEIGHTQPELRNTSLNVLELTMG
jgi:hypothetical protein